MLLTAEYELFSITQKDNKMTSLICDSLLLLLFFNQYMKMSNF